MLQHIHHSFLALAHLYFCFAQVPLSLFMLGQSEGVFTPYGFDHGCAIGYFMSIAFFKQYVFCGGFRLGYTGSVVVKYLAFSI